ncbi:hypothetical protein ACFWFQ_10675 [Nocardia salmonicida]|uniref:hypothetical protein n=1 Tax=Nocardia salmonicida TaxID=53431 RepID=UPI003653B380
MSAKRSAGARLRPASAVPTTPTSPRQLGPERLHHQQRARRGRQTQPQIIEHRSNFRLGENLIERAA